VLAREGFSRRRAHRVACFACASREPTIAWTR
jgi:hypothetical protein